MGIVGYSGPLAGAAFAAGVINEAWDEAQRLESEATAAANKARGKKPAVSPLPPWNLIDPDMYAQVDTLLSLENETLEWDWGPRNVRLTAARAGIVASITKDARAFLQTYFGDALNGTAAFDAATEWLQAAMEQGGTGVAAQTQLRVRDDARITADGRRALADAAARWGGARVPVRTQDYQRRGVTLLTGALRAGAERAERVHAWDLEVDRTAFSIERAAQMRDQALDLCRSFVTDWIKQLYDRTTQRETELLEREALLRRTYYGYMTQELGLRDVEVGRAKTGHDYQLTKWRDIEQQKITVYELWTKALQEQLRSLTTRAAGALNSIHVSAQSTAQETK